MPDLFNEKAHEWDANEMIQMLSAAVGGAILEQVPLHEQMQVLDFGAGTGLISSRVAPFVQRIVAVDISAAMLEKLAAKTQPGHKIDIVCQDILQNPLQERFDLIMSAMAMHHVEDTARLIQRFAQQLKPAGWVALADLDREDGTFHPAETEGVFHAGFERSELRALLEHNGFTDIRFVTAHTVHKEDKRYPIFLLLARKP